MHKTLPHAAVRCTSSSAFSSSSSSLLPSLPASPPPTPPAPGGSVIKATSTVASAGYRSARGARSVIRKFRFRLRGVRRTRWQKASRREAPPAASVARTGIVIKGLARSAKIFPSADFCPGTIHSAVVAPFIPFSSSLSLLATYCA